MLRIAAFESFYGGSHRRWLDGLKKQSRHDIRIFSLPDRFWKWRMHGGAITLARDFLQTDFEPDLILVSDMVDVNVLIGLLRRRLSHVPIALYMHENQITYPWSDQDRDVAAGRNHHYGFINYASALTSDIVLFNSAYHRNAFLEALPRFLKMFPDHQNAATIDKIADKSTVLRLAISLRDFDLTSRERSDVPVILWNHRWEYDKRPEAFFELLFRLKDKGVSFRLIVLGTRTEKYPSVFDQARVRLNDEIVHWGAVEAFEEYARLLSRADILPVTSAQDFFGMSAVEAMYCGCYPLLPDRLAFPGHIPSAHRHDHLYNSDEALEEHLIDLLANGVPRPDTRAWVAHYDWHHQIGWYDDLLERIPDSISN